MKKSFTKICRVCKETKSVCEFYSRKDSPDGYRSNCKVCQNKSNKQWGDRNKDKLRTYKREYYHINYLGTDGQKQKAKEWNKQYYALNRDSMIERATVYRKSERGREVKKKYDRRPEVMDKQRKRAATYYSTEIGKKQRKEWRVANKDAVNDATRRRRNKRRGNGGEFTEQQWNNLINMCAFRCLRCGEDCGLTVDHVIPVSLGGTSYISNIQPLCLSCNSKKGIKITDYRPEEIKTWATNQ